MNKVSVVRKIITASVKPVKKSAVGSASPNIALIKYWGKRNEELHLPTNSNVAISLPNKTISIQLTENNEDVVEINGVDYRGEHEIVRRNADFLDLFREAKKHFKITATMNFAAASGLASSAAWYAALVRALNDLYGWQLDSAKLSILARLGSGSACRSLWSGFVAWPHGANADGMDSHGVPLDIQWHDLRLGILTLTEQVKSISSREGMARCVATSPFFNEWVTQSEQAYLRMQRFITEGDFIALGELAEQNALAMHAVCMTACPPIVYSHPETLQVMQKIWQLRQQGLAVYFTQDAGANLILLFLQDIANEIATAFPGVEVVGPFV